MKNLIPLGGQAVLLHLGYGGVPLQGGPLLPESFGDMLRPYSDVDQHWTVIEAQIFSSPCNLFSCSRYYAIVHPMRAKYICTLSQARKIIISIWLLSALMACPTLLVQILLPVGERFKAFWCVRNWESRALWHYHEIYMLVLVLVVPALIMMVAYTLICWEVWRVMEKRSLMTSKEA